MKLILVYMPIFIGALAISCEGPPSSGKVTASFASEPAQNQQHARSSKPCDDGIVSECRQPNYMSWLRIKEGMSENDVVTLVGPPLFKDTAGNPDYAYSWTFGRLKFDSPVVPVNYDFYVMFQKGIVLSKQDPFNGHLSFDGSPSSPEPISPLNNSKFSHFPRVVDFRWQPSSGTCPIRYVVEYSSGYFERDGEKIALVYNEPITAETCIPHLAINFGGAAPGRWRVKAINRIGESKWSAYCLLSFSK